MKRYLEGRGTRMINEEAGEKEYELTGERKVRGRTGEGVG